MYRNFAGRDTPQGMAKQSFEHGVFWVPVIITLQPDTLLVRYAYTYRPTSWQTWGPQARWDVSFFCFEHDHTSEFGGISEWSDGWAITTAKFRHWSQHLPIFLLWRWLHWVMGVRCLGPTWCQTWICSCKQAQTSRFQLHGKHNG